MGMYMYKMAVPQDKKWISYDERHDLNDLTLNLATLRKYEVKEEDYFFIDEEEEQLVIDKRRLETDEEFHKRRQKAINYNSRYEEWHKNNPK